MKILRLLCETANYIENREKTLTYLKKISKKTDRPCKDLVSIWRDAALVAREEGKADDWDFTQGLFKSMAGINDAISEEMIREEDSGAGVSAGDVSGQAPEHMIGKPVRPDKPDEDEEQGLAGNIMKEAKQYQDNDHPTSTKQVTIYLRQKGLPPDTELVRGEGYFYFWGDEPSEWYSSNISTMNIKSMTFLDWYKEYISLRKNNAYRNGEEMEEKQGTIPQEMKSFFKERTARHINLVQKYAQKIADKFPEFKKIVTLAKDHDASKYKKPEYTPYLLITWDYRCKDKSIDFKVSEKTKDKMNNASLHHVTHNKHHPEYWQDEKEGLINKQDRDAIPDKMVDATKMPPLFIAEMIADWCAMGEEKKNTAKSWADKVVNKRWKFTPEQSKLIYKLIEAVENKEQESIKENNNNLKSISLLKNNLDKLANIAQQVYDKWDEEDIDTYAGGGVCHYIAEEIANYIESIGISATTVSSSHDVHVYTVAQVKEGIFIVDIPPSIYETGGGYSWKKIPEVEFSKQDITIYKVDPNPENIEQYIDSD